MIKASTKNPTAAPAIDSDSDPTSGASEKEQPRKQGLLFLFNDLVATKITIMVGIMWAFYAFVIFGLTPLIWPQHETQIL